MTTVAANLDEMCADTLVSYASSPFEGKPKIWTARHSIWGAAGTTHYCAAFRLWTLGKGKKPVFGKEEGEEDKEEDVRLEVLQLHEKDGLFLWLNNDLPEKIADDFYAIGSGAAHALGAMTMGASPAQAIVIAARYDSGTREPINRLTRAEIRRKRAG